MSNVSYSLMKKIITRKINAEMANCITKYKAMAEALDKEDSRYTEYLLSFSVDLSKEVKIISLNILNQYEEIVENDNELRKYKQELSKV